MPVTPPAAQSPDPPSCADNQISDQLERWLGGDDDHTLGGLIEVFEEKSFALLFILLLSTSSRS